MTDKIAPEIENIKLRGELAELRRENKALQKENFQKEKIMLGKQEQLTQVTAERTLALDVAYYCSSNECEGCYIKRACDLGLSSTKSVLVAIRNKLAEKKG